MSDTIKQIVNALNKPLDLPQRVTTDRSHTPYLPEGILNQGACVASSGHRLVQGSQLLGTMLNK